MINPVVKYTCYNCKKEVEIELESIRVIEHEGCACGCEYCDVMSWKHFEAECPKCHVINDTI